MKNMNWNDWIFLNEIIYKVNSTEDIVIMQKTFLNLIKTLIPYDKSVFFLSNESGEGFLSKPVSINFTETSFKKYLEIGEKIDYARWVMQCGKSMVYRDTDFFPGLSREDTQYYKTFYAPYNIHYCVQVTFCYNNILLGEVSLFRQKNKKDFTEKDMFILQMLKEHISYRLFRESIKTVVRQPFQSENINMDVYINQYNLTKREADVFKLLVEGCTYEEISKHLYISNHTLKKHVSSVYKKLGVKNRLQLFKVVGKKE